jgi:hypothetical protein
MEWTMNRTWLILALSGLALGLPGLSEACQQYRDIVHDRNGNVLTGVSVTIVRHGSSSPATIYTDPACETISANPISSGSTGEFIFYAQDGQYDLTFVKSGYTFIDVTNLAIYEPLGENVKTLGNFETDDLCATGIGAIDQIGADVVELVINRHATCSQSKTSPSTLTFRFEGQGQVTTNTPYTLTVNGPVKNWHGRSVWLGTGSYVFGSAAGPLPYGFAGIVAPEYGTSISIDASAGRRFIITATNNTAFAIAAPTKPTLAQEIWVTVKNTSGGALGAITWNSAFKLGAAWTSPATANSRSIGFFYDGTNWIEFSRTAADVSN